jgi:hypothetical protein
MLSIWVTGVVKAAISNTNTLRNQDEERVLSLAILRTHNIGLTKQRRRVQG